MVRRDDPTGGHGRIDKLTRRVVTIPAVVMAAVLLTLAVPLWLPIAIVVDAVTGRWRFPLARLLAYGTCYAWLEVAGLTWLFQLWVLGRARDQDAHYAVMSWWAGSNMNAIGRIMGFEMRLVGAEQIEGGNAIVMARHASLADSLLSAWAVCTTCGVETRYVLKRELLFDPLSRHRG